MAGPGASAGGVADRGGEADRAMFAGMKTSGAGGLGRVPWIGEAVPNWRTDWRLRPACGPVVQVGVIPANMVRWPPDRTLEQVADPVLQDAVRRKPDRVFDPFGFRIFLDIGLLKPTPVATRWQRPSLPVSAHRGNLGPKNQPLGGYWLRMIGSKSRCRTIVCA